MTDTNNTNGRTLYTHIAYATSADGTQGFSITDAEGKNYFGYYTDYMAEDSQNPSDYTWENLTLSPHDEPGPAGEEGVPVEPKPNIGNKRIPKWLQWVVVIMVTGAIGFNFAGLAIGVVLWFLFDWINGDL